VGVLFANDASTTLAVAIDTDDTTITVATGEGSKFPAPTGGDWFALVLDGGAALEIVHCTARSGDDLTVSRGAEGTTPASWGIGARGDLRVTKEGLEDIIANGGGGSVQAGFRNILHNGGFQVAQRGAGPFTSASTYVNSDDRYLLDGCILLSDGNDIVDVSQASDADFVSGQCCAADVETANKKFGFLLPIESRDIQAIRKSGKASVQFKAKVTGSSIANIRAHLLAWSSTADAITSDVVSAWNAAGSNPTFVTNWTAENVGSNLAVTTTIATFVIEDIDVDTSGVTNLALFIHIDDTDATVGDFLKIGDVQVEEGAVAGAYEHRPVGYDLRACQRFVESGTDGFFWAEGTSTKVYEKRVYFQATKPFTPTMSYADTGSSGFPAGAPTPDGASVRHATVNKTANATGGIAYNFSWFATSEL
jgi:hypothetical protein